MSAPQVSSKQSTPLLFLGPSMSQGTSTTNLLAPPFGRENPTPSPVFVTRLNFNDTDTDTDTVSYTSDASTVTLYSEGDANDNAESAEEEQTQAQTATEAEETDNTFSAPTTAPIQTPQAMPARPRTNNPHEIPLVSHDTMDAIRMLIKSGCLSVDNEECLAELERSARRESFTPFQCEGCPSTCVERWSLFLIRSLTDAQLARFFSSHGYTFGQGKCTHSTLDGRTLVLTMSPEGRCPFPKCTKADTNSMGPLFPSRAADGAINKKTIFYFLYANGIGNTQMRNLFDIGVSLNTLTEWRKSAEEVAAAAHILSAKYYEGGAQNVQFDEFVISSPKYGRGRSSSASDGQMWFQSCVILAGLPGGTQRVLRYFVRFVPNRSKETLVPWMLSMVGDGANVATDSWSAYDTLVEEAAKVGKTIKHHRVNHSVQFQNHNGITTNAIEGMHHQTKKFLSRLGVSGTTGMQRMIRVLASAELCNVYRYEPDVTRRSPVNRFRRFLGAASMLVEHGVPALEILACASVGKDVFSVVKAQSVSTTSAQSQTPSRRAISKLVDEDGVEVFPAAASATKRTRGENASDFDTYREEAREIQRANYYAVTSREERLLKRKAKLERAAEKSKLEKLKRDRILDEAANNKYAHNKKDELIQQNLEAVKKKILEEEEKKKKK